MQIVRYFWFLRHLKGHGHASRESNSVETVLRSSDKGFILKVNNLIMFSLLEKKYFLDGSSCAVEQTRSPKKLSFLVETSVSSPI